jgi:O-antigen ligase
MKGIFRDGLEALSEIKNPERIFFFLWLLGPLFFLIERSPADIWVTIIGLAFLVRCAIIQNWSWLRQFWVRTILAFWMTLFISSAFSPFPILAFIESVIWIRFPLLVFASVFWFSKDRRIVNSMLLCTGFGLLCMVLILTLELFLNHDNWLETARLTWPYGDAVSGNYLAKVGLIITVFAATLLFEADRQKQIAGFIVSLLILIFTILTGERINSILVFCALITTVFWCSKKNLKHALIAITLFSVVSICTLSIHKKLLFKFTTNFASGLTDFERSGYIEIWQSGLNVFYAYPFTGIGTGMYRSLCNEKILRESLDTVCNNHPHQMYVQALAETGAIGFIAFSTMAGSIVTLLWKEGMNAKNTLSKCCFIVPLGLFFPIQSSADLFGQWINGMTWCGLALAMAVFSTEKHSKEGFN